MKICAAWMLAMLCGPAAAHAQDLRTVTEPHFPPTCVALQAPLPSNADGPLVAETAEAQDAESGTETSLLAAALNRCPAGQAVELTTGLRLRRDAFLINPVSLPPGVSLIVDGGVTVYATRDAANFQDPATLPATVCGTVGGYPVDVGCVPLLSLQSASGIYGYGVLDGQGQQPLIRHGRIGTATWWSLLNVKRHKTCTGGCEQAAPMMVSTGVVPGTGQLGTDLTLYGITIRNPPFHTVRLAGTGVTAWGVKVQAPWNVANTDGFDVHGSDITIEDAIVANGDQEIAVTSDTTPTTNLTVERFRGYSKGGIAFLADGAGILNALVHDARITADLPSVVQTDGTWYVNGVPVLDRHDLAGYWQALPTGTGDVHGLQISTDLYAGAEAKPGGVFSNIIFDSACLQDVNRPFYIGPVVPFTRPKLPSDLPSVSGVTFRDVHVLAPDPVQFPQVQGGVTTGKPGTYALTFVGYPRIYYNGFSLDDVVFDDTGGMSSIGAVVAVGNTITTRKNVYPPLLNALQAPFVKDPVPVGGLTLSANRYAGRTPITSPTPPPGCPGNPWPFITGALFISLGDAPATGTHTNLPAATIPAGGSVTLNAVVQPIMSQTTHFLPNGYGATPGLLAVGSPALRNPIVFYENGSAIAFAGLSANGTLASATIGNVQAGTHTYTALYPGDAYYGRLRFGSVTVTATP